MLDFFKKSGQQSSFGQKKDDIKSKLKWIIILIVAGYFVINIIGVGFNARDINNNNPNADTNFISKIFNKSDNKTPQTSDTNDTNNTKKEKTGFAAIRIAPINIILYAVVLFILWVGKKKTEEDTVDERKEVPYYVSGAEESSNVPSVNISDIDMTFKDDNDD